MLDPIVIITEHQQKKRPSHPVHVFQNRNNLKIGIFCTTCQKNFFPVVQWEERLELCGTSCHSRHRTSSDQRGTVPTFPPKSEISLPHYHIQSAKLTTSDSHDVRSTSIGQVQTFLSKSNSIMLTLSSFSGSDVVHWVHL